MRRLTPPSLSLHIIVSCLLVAATLAGMTATFLWMDTERRWNAHLERAAQIGTAVYWSQRTDMPPPSGVVIETVGLEDTKLARAGKFSLMSSIESTDLVTQLSLSGVTGMGERAQIGLAIASPDLKYPVGRIAFPEQGADSTLAGKLGQISVLIANYCSDATLYMKYDTKPWVRVKADPVWSCASAPADYRLFAAALLAVALITLLATAKAVSGTFSDFAAKLLSGTATDTPQPYVERGPGELRAVIRGINQFIEKKTDSLERRARFLSGVSHDLGTPAARLRLRTRFVEDAELRRKIDSDIEAMTGMIESVLNYTQSEINVEAKRSVSLLSIVEAIVADFQDEGQPVTLSPYVTPQVKPQTLLFSRRSGKSRDNTRQQNPEERHNAAAIAVVAQPLAITRAVTNLVDNALKYGRRANLSVEADLTMAKIHVDDFGTLSDGAEMEGLVEPFRRGDNARYVKGFGIGLAVASTVAEQHGGHIEFARRQDGLRATLSILRNH